MNEKTPRVLVATTGWYGLGHLTPVVAVIEALKRQTHCRVALYALPFEVARLERQGQRQLFDRIYTGAPSDAHDYVEYTTRHYVENRLRFHHAFPRSGRTSSCTTG